MNDRITDERLRELATWEPGAKTSALSAQRAEWIAMARELAELREQVRWRPMEEAPRDGTHVLAFFPDWQCTGEPRVMAVKWTGPPDSKHNRWSIPGHGGLSPTVWRPIGPLPGGDA